MTKTVDKKIKVLHVEDNPFTAMFVAIPFRKIFDYKYADSVNAGLERLMEKKYDFVITDGSLESNHGNPNFETGKRIAQAAKEQEAYVIGVSSEPDKFYKIAGKFIDYNYKKPMDLLHLIKKIQEEYQKRSE